MTRTSCDPSARVDTHDEREVIFGYQRKLGLVCLKGCTWNGEKSLGESMLRGDFVKWTEQKLFLQDFSLLFGNMKHCLSLGTAECTISRTLDREKQHFVSKATQTFTAEWEFCHKFL
ncbi:hypothetical protein CEXT_74701 [Caerostris extrusa]|uniref:Uncharacterized protein n=1 Tax=Caerostris extrusa TaxID=172846 RepID=A0AAV4T9P3_CAEEX|nr:hypothetical protein CEXT_74701 [Caerostris extrusa]